MAKRAPTRAERRRAERTGRKAPPPAAAPQPTEADRALARRARTIGVTLAGVAILWFAATAIGAALGIPARWAVLVDLTAGAAFIWGLAATWRIWQKRRD